MKTVVIHITGTQEIDGQKDTVEITTEGTMEAVEKGFSLCYKETVATGMEGGVTTISTAPSQVTMERAGTHASLMVFEKRRRHQCSYNTPYGPIMLGVYTDALQDHLTAKGGEIEIRYTLDMNAHTLSRHYLRITVH